MTIYLPAFMSHAHADNVLCDPLHHALTQRGVACYYDRANPQTGHSLSMALQTELERAQVLIVMVSPAMLASFWVEQEIDMFFALMAEERQRMLIPIKIAPCDLPIRLRARWWLDATTGSFDALIEQLAQALTTSPLAKPDAAPLAASVSQNGAHASVGGYTRTVDWRRNMGDHTSVVEAVAAAQPGERILVRRGVYEGGLLIDKPLELVGDGQPGDVELRASGADVIFFSANQGRVANLTLRQTGDGSWYGVDITSGRLELEDCDISSQSLACVAIHSGATPIVRRNIIHDGASSGVFVYEGGNGLIEDNDIFGNGNVGVAIKEGSAPTLRRNRIHDGKQGGVLIYEQGQGLLEDNDITANAYAGVCIKNGATPTLRRNRIHDGLSSGVFVCEQGKGLLEDNDISGNALAGIEIKQESAPTLRRNRIHNGVSTGVFIQAQGQGLLEDNDIFENKSAGVEVKQGSTPTLRRNRIHKNGYEAIWVYEQGGGVYEENDLRDNTRGPWDISDDSKAQVTKRGNVE